MWSLFCSIRVYISLHFLPTGKLVFCLSMLFVFFACSEFDIVFMNFYNVFIIIVKIVGVRSGPLKRFWDSRGQKCFGCLEEWHKSEFPRKRPWQNTISEKVGGMVSPGLLSLGDLQVLCAFVLTYQKRFVRSAIKIWLQFLIKSMPHRIFEF